MKHAEVKIGEYTIPLIGIPPDASKQECAGCRRLLYLGDVELNEAGTKFLCAKCRKKRRPLVKNTAA